MDLDLWLKWSYYLIPKNILVIGKIELYIFQKLFFWEIEFWDFGIIDFLDNRFLGFSIAKKIFTFFEKKFIVEIYPLFSVCIHKIVHILKRCIFYMLLKIFFFVFLAANFYSNNEINKKLSIYGIFCQNQKLIFNFA